MIIIEGHRFCLKLIMYIFRIMLYENGIDSLFKPLLQKYIGRKVQKIRSTIVSKYKSIEV